MPKPPAEFPDHLGMSNPKLDKRMRRQFSPEYKLRIFAESDASRMATSVSWFAAKSCRAAS